MTIYDLRKGTSMVKSTKKMKSLRSGKSSKQKAEAQRGDGVHLQ